MSSLQSFYYGAPPSQTVTSASVSMALSVPAGQVNLSVTSASVSMALSVPAGQAYRGQSVTSASVSMALSVPAGRVTLPIYVTSASVSTALSVPAGHVLLHVRHVTSASVSVALSVPAAQVSLSGSISAESVPMALSVPAGQINFSLVAPASVSVALSIPSASTSAHFTATASIISMSLSVPVGQVDFVIPGPSPLAVDLSIPSASTSLTQTASVVSVALSVTPGEVIGDVNITSAPVSVALSVIDGLVRRLPDLIQTASPVTLTLSVTSNYSQVLAVFSTIVNAVVTQIEALNLTGIADADIIRVKRPLVPLNGGTKPDTGVQVFQINQIDVGGTNARDDFAYRVGIVAFQKSNADQDLNEDRPPAWIQAIRREFNSKRLTGVHEAYFCRMEPVTTVDPFRFPQFYDVSNLVLRVTTREVRTQ